MHEDEWHIGHGHHMGIGFGRKERGYRYGFGLKYFILEMASRDRIKGADIMNRIEELSHGYWRPSPGHVYFELDRLVSNGYLKRIEEDNNRYYEITEQGKELLKEIEEWFPFKKILAQNNGNESKDKIKDKILNEIKALEQEENLNNEEKKRIELIKELIEKL